MSAAEVNIPLLRKAVEWAEAEAAKPPELCEWKQDSFYLPKKFVGGAGRAPECGSCFCIAGYVAQLEQPLSSSGSEAPELAAAALGMSLDDAWALFDSHNTIADVRRIAETLAGERL